MHGMTFVGLPIDSVGRAGGTEFAPAALRELGILSLLEGLDAGDLNVRIRGEGRDPETGIVGSPDVMATTATVRIAIGELIAAGARPFLGGGCCAGLPGALAGARDALGRVGLVHLDGHLDLYDGVTSPTGEGADMPVSVALGLGPARWVEEAGGPSLTPGHEDRGLPGPRGVRGPASRAARSGADPSVGGRGSRAGHARGGRARGRHRHAVLAAPRRRRARRAGLPRHRLPDAGRHDLGRAARRADPGDCLAAPDRHDARLLQPREGSRHGQREGANGRPHAPPFSRRDCARAAARRRGAASRAGPSGTRPRPTARATTRRRACRPSGTRAPGSPRCG